MKKYKNLKIQENLEGILDDVGSMTHKLYGAVNHIRFSGKLSSDSIKKIRFHLGYLKNYSDLAKVRLSYSRTAMRLENNEQSNKSTTGKK